MGEERNVDVARRVIEAIVARDADAALRCFDVGGLFEPLSTPVRRRAPGEAAGHAGLRRYLADLDRAWERFDISVERWDARGDVVVALGRIHAVARDAGYGSMAPIALVFRLRDGKIVHGKAYASHAEALAAADLTAS